MFFYVCGSLTTVRFHFEFGFIIPNLSESFGIIERRSLLIFFNQLLKLKTCKRQWEPKLDR